MDWDADGCGTSRTRPDKRHVVVSNLEIGTLKVHRLVYTPVLVGVVLAILLAVFSHLRGDTGDVFSIASPLIATNHPAVPR